MSLQRFDDDPFSVDVPVRCEASGGGSAVVYELPGRDFVTTDGLRRTIADGAALVRVDGGKDYLTGFVDTDGEFWPDSRIYRLVAHA